MTKVPVIPKEMPLKVKLSSVTVRVKKDKVGGLWVNKTAGFTCNIPYVGGTAIFCTTSSPSLNFG